MKSMKSTIERTDEEEVLKILGEKSPVGVCVMQDGKFCYVNSNFPIATGYTADELIGKDPLELIVPEDRKMVRENEIKMLNGELIPPYQFRVIHKDGSIRWVMEAVRSVQYHGRRAVLGHYMEVTECKQMEEALKESEENYRELANSITDVFFAMDEHLRYTYWNKSSEILTGIRVEDAIGKSLSEIFPDTPWRRRAERVYRAVLRTQQPQTFVNDYDINGRHYILAMSAYPSRGGISVFVKDITESEQAEEALQIEKNKLQSVIDAMADGLTIQDTEYNIIYQNEPARISSGGDRVGEKCYRVYEGRESICEDCPVEKAFKDGKPHTSERQQALPSRELSFWETTANPIRDARGEIVSCLEIGRDITERKKQEQALADELTQRRLLVDQSIDGIVVLDVDAKVYEANQRFAEMLGYTLEEVRELHTWDWDKNFPPEQILEMGREVDEKGLHLETKHTRKDGSVIDVDISINGTMCGGQKLIFCVCRDITERKEMEEALRESEKKLRLISENSRDIICLHDPDHRYVYISPACKEILGYEPDELVGTNPWELVHPEDIEALQKEGQEKVLQGMPALLSYRIRKKSGEYAWFESVSQLLKDGAGNVLGFVTSSRDITERKRAEEALGQSEEKYRTILEEMEDSYFEVDLGGHLTFVNNSVCRDLGYSREELIGMSYKDFTIEDDIESVFRVFNEVYRTDVPNKGFPWKTVRKDGVCGFAETSISVLRNDKGEIIGFRGVGRDVTERKKMEEAINLQRAYFQQLFDNSPDAILMMATNDRAIQANRGFEVLFGYSNEEVKGRSLIELIIPEVDVQEASDSLQRILGGEVVRKESVRRRKDGSLVDVSVLAYPIRFNDKLVGTYGVYSDITERKQAEEKLRQSEENYKTLFNSSVIGTFVLDAETMKIVIGNQAAAEMLGFSSVEEAIGINPLDFILLEDREMVLEIVTKELFEQDLRRTQELRMITKDGREIWISATAARIMHEGKLAGLISFTDITEEKRQRERLMMTDRLASLGELASGTAHELNNPLTSIIGFSQLLMEREVPDDIREDLKLINNEAQRAASVTKNLLTFARKHAPEKQLNQINNIIEDVLKLRAYEYKANNIEVERQFAPNLPEIMADYFQIQQVFMNIIINAEYFMINEHNKGTLTITTKKQKDTVMILFADDGAGIPPESLRRIFDPFFTTKEAGKGTGLGLSICHGIVTEHGGQIYARNQQGKGATIFVELPINGH